MADPIPVTIEFKYKGACIGGPWRGQRLEAENPFVRPKEHDPNGGLYHYNNGGWVWMPPGEA